MVASLPMHHSKPPIFKRLFIHIDKGFHAVAKRVKKLNKSSLKKQVLISKRTESELSFTFATYDKNISEY